MILCYIYAFTNSSVCVYLTDKCAGRLVLGSFMFARGKELEHWNQAIASPREPVYQWHTLA